MTVVLTISFLCAENVSLELELNLVTLRLFVNIAYKDHASTSTWVRLKTQTCSPWVCRWRESAFTLRKREKKEKRIHNACVCGGGGAVRDLWIAFLQESKRLRLLTPLFGSADCYPHAHNASRLRLRSPLEFNEVLRPPVHAQLHSAGGEGEWLEKGPHSTSVRGSLGQGGANGRETHVPVVLRWAGVLRSRLLHASSGSCQGKAAVVSTNWSFPKIGPLGLCLW